MSVSYDVFTRAFLYKIDDYGLLGYEESVAESMTDDFLRKSVAAFKKNCLYDLTGSMNNEERIFDLDIEENDIDEIVDILSEGMVVQWLKPFLYRQEGLEMILNTRDYTQYSPADLLFRINNTYASAEKRFIQMIREYSYNHGNLRELHL